MHDPRRVDQHSQAIEPRLAEDDIISTRLTVRVASIVVAGLVRQRDRWRYLVDRLDRLGGWPGIMVRTIRGGVRDDFGIAASSIAFAAFLALFPLLTLVVFAYGSIVAPDAATRVLSV